MARAVILAAFAALVLSGCGGAPDFIDTYQKFTVFYQEQAAALDAGQFDEAQFKIRRDEFEAELREVEHAKVGGFDNLPPDELAAFKGLVLAKMRFDERWLAFVKARNAASAVPVPAPENAP